MGGRLALAFGVGDDNVDHPAIHASINNATTFDVDGFFARAGRKDTAYAIRVNLYVDYDLKRAYVCDPSLFEAHLRQVGVTCVSDERVRVGREIAGSPSIWGSSSMSWACARRARTFACPPAFPSFGPSSPAPRFATARTWRESRSSPTGAGAA